MSTDQPTRLQIIALPTTAVEHERGGFTEGSEFWVHTLGMSQRGRPEVEMVRVPAMWLREAMDMVRSHAEAIIEAGLPEDDEDILEEGHPFDYFIRIAASPDENQFWATRSLQCVRLTLGACVLSQGCAHCDGCPNEGECEDGEDDDEKGPSDPSMWN